jgi:phosphate-selective porin OprO/OprP
LNAQAAWSQTTTPTAPVTGFQDGFFIQSPDGNNRLTLGFIAHVDGRFSLDEPAPAVSTFTIRRLRPIFTGRVARYFEYRMIPDFGNGTALVQDAYFDFRVASSFRLRAGKDKVPIGYEMLTPAARLLFPERSIASGLVPNRDVGVQAIGEIARGKASYAAGIFNGIADNSTSTTDLDSNGSKDLAGRVVVRPFNRASDRDPQPLDGLGFHIGASTGRQGNSLPAYRTSVLQSYFAYANGAVANGVRNRITPAVFYYYRSFGGFAEYMRSAQAVMRSGVRTDVANHGWDVTASYLLTGETATTGIMRPTRKFDPEAGHWGALQLAVRYASVSIDRAAFDTGLAAADASRGAKALGIVANWFPNAYVKYAVMFERTAFRRDAAGGRSAENLLLLRSQLAF